MAKRSVVVTGASSGVGRAIARAFGECGDFVGLVARNEEALQHAAVEIRDAGGQALPLPLDVSDPLAVDAAAERMLAETGSLDIWINCAMVSVFSPALEMTPAEFQRITEVNYLGTVYGTTAALRRMRRLGHGHVIQIGSALAYRSIPLQSAYCASKAAIRGFTDSLRCELLHDRLPIHLSMMQLPAVNTPQFDVVRSRLPRRAQPVPPIFQPEMIARATLYVAEHPVRELWIAGSAIKAILAQRFIPGLLDRYLAKNGYDAQQTEEPAERRPDNLLAPLPGDRGAHGRFDERSRRRSLALWPRLHWRGLTAAAVAVGACLPFFLKGAKP